MSITTQYRPATFAGVVGQDATKQILINSILMERVPPAVLISGIRGTGKTTIARVFAAALNCPEFPTIHDCCGRCPACVEVRAGTMQDVLEQDAASNNGVDDVRQLELIVGQVQMNRHRVIILDEAHMLSKPAQAALLKAIEEPPQKTTFALVTTDPQKIEETVRSRCMNLHLKTLNPSEIALSLLGILQAENRQVDDGVVETLSNLGGGSLRDAQQVLYQSMIAAGNGPITNEILSNVAGVLPVHLYQDLIECFLNNDLRFFIDEIEKWYREGVDLVHLMEEGVPNLLRDLSVFVVGAHRTVSLLSGIRPEAFDTHLAGARIEWVRWLEGCWEPMVEMIRTTSTPRVIWQLFAVKACGHAQ